MAHSAARVQPRGRGRPRGGQVLDRRAILAAALRLVDEAGLDALSMRGLGARLGVEAMALYNYFPGKGALVQALAEPALEELDLPRQAEADTWEAFVREVARAFRRLGLAHPEVFPLVATLGLDHPAARRTADTILRALDAAGFDPTLAFTAFTVIRSYVAGHVLWHLGAPVAGPRPTRTPPPRPRDSDADAHFERGLDVLVAGLRALLPPRP